MTSTTPPLMVAVMSLRVSLLPSAFVPCVNLPMTEHAWSLKSGSQTSVCSSRATMASAFGQEASLYHIDEQDSWHPLLLLEGGAKPGPYNWVEALGELPGSDL